METGTLAASVHAGGGQVVILGALDLRAIQFRRFRRKQGDDGGRRAAGAFRIVFSAPVSGPICLGHSSHFGLGLFMPSDAEDRSP